MVSLFWPQHQTFGEFLRGLKLLLRGLTALQLVGKQVVALNSNVVHSCCCLV